MVSFRNLRYNKRFITHSLASFTYTSTATRTNGPSITCGTILSSKRNNCGEQLVGRRIVSGSLSRIPFLCYIWKVRGCRSAAVLCALLSLISYYISQLVGNRQQSWVLHPCGDDKDAPPGARSIGPLRPSRYRPQAGERDDVAIFGPLPV